jgi:hypothetical protein
MLNDNLAPAQAAEHNFSILWLEDACHDDVE